eukprot:CAMPEP_0194748588 /NCGR_PEP_ID=MMETSP0323_2-20130528/2731_1 /TAXON_ID=2866 ORGANISM="Crypthecodinium cohnii, Strain Seligo" /NCGR_SAMPLE_ID=MMETSP0323_2 /ASSEMBLY_ACC=CAM_ASM_000346 /LENGTH=37 /DNA_ID= /DNA_START= /DNA_END= /DNA_ORIENTATION=
MPCLTLVAQDEVCKAKQAGGQRVARSDQSSAPPTFRV